MFLEANGGWLVPSLERLDHHAILLDRRHHSGILASAAQTGLRQALDSPDVRHALAAAAIDNGLRSDFAAFLSPFLRPEDFDWLIAQYRAVDEQNLPTLTSARRHRKHRPTHRYPNHQRRRQPPACPTTVSLSSRDGAAGTSNAP